MANTTNFNWETPDDTDLVKDGAAAIRTLGSAIDTSLVDLKGGTTGQILSKTSNTDMDFVWVTNDVGDITEVVAGTGLSGGGSSGSVTLTNTVATEFDAKGDLVVGTGADTFDKLSVGTNGYTLVADSAETTGLKWAAPSSGAMTLVQRSTFSNVANTGTTFDAVFSSAYKSYLLVIESIYASTASDDLHLQYRYAGPTTQTTDYHGNSLQFIYNSTTITNLSQNNTAQITLNLRTGFSTQPGSGQYSIYGVSGSSAIPILNGSFTDPNNFEGSYTNASQGTARIYTGFLLKSSSTNITGTVAVYGLA